MRRLIALAAIIGILLSLSGCGLFSETYVSVRSHQAGNHNGQTGQQIATSYPEIYTALVTLIGQGDASGVIVLTDMDEQVAGSYMQAAVKNVVRQDPVGAFAVEQIDYDIGTNAGRMAAAVQIHYSRSRTDIAQIKSVNNIDEAEDVISQALEQVSDSVVLRIEQYENTDFSDLVHSCWEKNPMMIMEIPQVMTAVYPQNGQNRLVELTFTYQNTRENLLKMQALVRPVFTAAELYVQGEPDQLKKFRQLSSFLIERTQYQIRSTSVPAYGLLQEGIGDSKAFACIYAAMCKQSGLECRMISGMKDGNEWYWNRVVINNRVYYIDLIEGERTGQMAFRTASEMIGYQWER